MASEGAGQDSCGQGKLAYGGVQNVLWLDNLNCFPENKILMVCATQFLCCSNIRLRQ